jgi:thiol-disulfide isomerase/thioredoxin
MKKLIALAVFIFYICGMTISAQNITVKNPFWRYSNTHDLITWELNLQPNQTILSFKVVILNKWKMMPSLHLEAEGKNYAYRGGSLYRMKDGKYTETTFTPDSLNMGIILKDDIVNPDSLVLRFDPLPPNVHSIDFIEGKDEPAKNTIAWKILGIKTDSGPYPCSLKPQKENSKSILPPYTPKFGKSIFTAHINGYCKEMESSIFHYDYQNYLTGEYDAKSNIDSVGNFTVETTASFPVYLRLKLLNKNFYTILVPGTNLEFEINAPTLTAYNSYHKKDLKGETGIRMSGPFAPMNEALNNSLIFQEVNELIKLTKMNFTQYVDHIWKNYLKNIEELQSNKKYNPQKRDFLNFLYQFRYVSSYISYTEKVKDGISRAKRRNEPGADTLKIENYLSQFTIKDSHAKNLTLFNDLRAIYVLGDNNLMDYAKANGYQTSKVYQWMTDLKKAKEKANQIASLNPVKDESGWKGIAPQYLTTLKQFNDTILAKIKSMNSSSKSAVHIKQIPNVPADKLIQTLVDQYKGQVVMIDCWTTWCGPCKRGIAKMESIKNELKGKNVIFIYLTNETSGASTWYTDIQKIPGEHYRISNNIWNKIPNLQGMPHYYIFDKNGKKIIDEEGWQDGEENTFKDTILKALE